MKRTLLVGLLLAGAFQAGRLTERAIWPCRLRPLAGLVAPLLGQELPSPELCDLMLKLPSF
ncbi:hypothetical protein KBY66_13415 [Synechococcus sp. Tobar12-5m-g]|uniref:hypothetical protein n=1 Tax=unclassified Synechococcus TaxID=2626047 RepID=UPI0020CE3BCF|nr:MULTISPECIES: hypothetical protein [unclassified Synechococcus]MCP9773599.1 hypothetical protein [Synechococcus sp. Tobar12-5m-g]MCP9874571.1 hypothetical protein [Synechococcus sp. Cruz CV-v-12]